MEQEGDPNIDFGPCTATVLFQIGCLLMLLIGQCRKDDTSVQIEGSGLRSGNIAVKTDSGGSDWGSGHNNTYHRI